MPILILDDTFNRADTAGGVLGNGWSVLGTDMHILNNQAATLLGIGDVPPRSAYYPVSIRDVQLIITTPAVSMGGGANDVHMQWGGRFSQTDKCGYWIHVWAGNQRFLSVTRSIDGVSLTGTTGGQTGDNQIPALAPNTQYRVVVNIQDGPGVGQTTISVTVALLSDPNTIIASASAVDTSPSLQRFGYATIGSSTQTGQVAHGVADEILIYDLGSDAPNAGSIANGTVDGVNHVIVSTASPTGGTPPLSNAWYRSRTKLFTPGPSNIVAGQTGLNFTGLAPDTEVWDYVRRTIDSAIPPKTSDTVVLEVARGNPTYRICEAGDSITAGSGNNYPAFTINQVLPFAAGPRTVTVFPAALAGAYMANETGRDPFFVMQPRFANNFYNVGVNLVLGVVQTIATYNCNMASIRLGINDSPNTTPQHFGEELDLAIADMKSRGVTWVVLHSPNYCHFSNDQAGSDRTANLESYRSVLLSRVDNATIFDGDFDCWQYYANHPEEQSDGVHMDSRVHLAYLETASLIRVFDRIEGKVSLPSTGNVRFGTSYGGSLTGTLLLPSPSDVKQGVRFGAQT